LRDLILRALFGGVIVTVFAEFGDVFQPKRFAGLFGAAPSVALATLGLTIASQGKNFAELEARSMLLGAAAFFVYAYAVFLILLRFKTSAMATATLALPVWFAVALALWSLCLR
jgi:hypothetical protein